MDLAEFVGSNIRFDLIGSMLASLQWAQRTDPSAMTKALCRQQLTPNCLCRLAPLDQQYQ